MHIVNLLDLVPGEEGENPYLSALLTELAQIKKQKARIYETYVDTDDTDPSSNVVGYTFITTSKDIHLEFGTFGWMFQMHIAKFLEHEFLSHKCSQLLFSIKHQNENDGKVLITMTVNPERKEMIFTISPAHCK